MHKLLAGDGYAYLTRQVAAGDVGLGWGEPLVAYYEATGTPPGRWLGAGLAALGATPIGIELPHRPGGDAWPAAHDDGRGGRDDGPGRVDDGWAQGDDAAARVDDGRLWHRRVRPGDVVSEAGMVALFRDGCDPLTGAALGRGYAGRRVRPVVGFDLTFTIPKSASVLWALGDARTRSAVVHAHHAAVSQALRFVEHSVLRTRVGAAGCRQVRTRGMLAAGFDHWDSRAGDPNLHTHVVLANKVQGPDKVWRALDGTTIHAATVMVSELYDGLVADELHRRLPVTWSARPRGEGRNPAWEIDGLDDQLLAAFSSRSERIHEAELDWTHQFRAARGRGPSRVETIRARQHLTRTTRPAKVVRPLAELFTEWANRARALTGAEPVDLAARALAGDYARGLHAHDVGPEVRDAVIAQVLVDVSARRSVWSTWNLGAATARVTKPLRMVSARERQALIDQVTRGAAGRCVHLDDTRDPATSRIGEALFTTAELLGAERVLLDAAASSDFPHPLRGWEADALARDPHLADLTADQSAAVQAILTSTRRLDVLVGPAGAGKTTTLTALTQIAQDHGRTVIGLAPSASAAHTLSTALGIHAETTAKWLHEACGPGAAARAMAHDAALARAGDPSVPWRQRQAATEQVHAARVGQDAWRFTLGQVVVVDEASLADTRTLATLVQLADQADARIVLVGDHHQRGPVGAGGAFGMLARRGPTAELVSLHRFTHPWEARATLDLRHGQPSALDAYAAHGAIHDGELDTLIDQALDAAQAATTAGKTTLLQAADLRTVRELNNRAHQRAILTGHAQAGGVALRDGLTAGVGDQILTRHNNRRLRTPDGHVRNGALWHVTAIAPDGALHVRPATASLGGREKSVRLPADYVTAHVELGYAVTTARSQGLTLDESHTIATPGMAREDLYVALTRGRDHNHLYVATDLPQDHCPPSITGTGGRPTARQVLDQVLASSHAELSATETWTSYHPLVDAPVPPPARPHTLSPRYIDQLHHAGILERPRQTRAHTPPTPTRGYGRDAISR